MKLTRDAFERIGIAPPLDMFNQGIRAEETREKYTRTLRYVMCVILEEMLEGSFVERVEQFVKLSREDPDWTIDILLNISGILCRRTKLPPDHPDYYNPVSFNNYFKPVKKLLEMNNIAIQWKRIHMTFPEIDNISDTRGWYRGEIRQMLETARGPIERALILVAASSGIRIGGFNLKWGHLKPVYRNGDKLSFEKGEGSSVACVMLSIYHKTSSQYPAFITSEAYDAILRYRTKWTAEAGREPGPDDPLFKKSGNGVQRATLVTIKRRMERMLENSGLRTGDRKTNKRYDVPMMNGFRRFWNKSCKESLSRDSPLASLIKKEYMMGHIGLVSLDKNYFKAHSMELAEEYLTAVPNLTIGEAARLEADVRRKDDEIRGMKDKQGMEIEKLRAMVEELTVRLDG